MTVDRVGKKVHTMKGQGGEEHENTVSDRKFPTFSFFYFGVRRDKETFTPKFYIKQS